MKRIIFSAAFILCILASCNAGTLGMNNLEKLINSQSKPTLLWRYV